MRIPIRCGTQRTLPCELFLEAVGGKLICMLPRDSAGDRQKGHHQLSIRFCYVLLIDPLISVGLNDRRLRAVAGPAAKAPVKS